MDRAFEIAQSLKETSVFKEVLPRRSLVERECRVPLFKYPGPTSILRVNNFSGGRARIPRVIASALNDTMPYVWVCVADV